MPPQLDRSILEIALAGLEAQKEKILAQIRQVKEVLGGSPAQTTATGTSDLPTGRRKKFSAATRKKMAEAQRLRYAKSRGEIQSPEAAPAPTKKKRKMSAAGRKAISEATKKRWADLRAAKEQAEARPTRKKAGRKKAARKAAVKTAPTAA